ncbi:MAG: FtsX-like permease family protein [Deltaproteobacteria bacterium]|nr:FtsX-like permease family protein [Deltaproteobacteria bacterium]
MKALNRKLLRDLMRSKGQVITISLVIACSAAGYVALTATHHSLAASRDAYYAAQNFPQLFASVRRAPESLARRLEELPGIARLETRLALAIRIDMPGLPEPAVGRLVSLPGGHAPRLDQLHLGAGRNVDPTRTDEVLLLASFARAHGLLPGAWLSTVIDGRRQRLHVVGIAESPEHIFPIGPSGFGDDRRFAVLWMARAPLAGLSGAEGAFHEVVAWLQPGASEAAALAALERVLEPYGSPGPYGRALQLSNRFVTGEIAQLEGIALRVPLIFLVVAAFLLNISLSRLVQTQREQIAALKALGYRRRDIALHYLGFVAVMVVLGLIMGLAFGTWWGQSMARMYARFFHFPVLRYELDAQIILTAVAVSALAAGGGAMLAVRRAARLPPAEAMRPQTPTAYRRGVLSRLGVGRLVSHSGRMVVRELERRPLRALLSSLGIAAGLALLVVGRFSEDSMTAMFDLLFGSAQRADVTVAFRQPLPASAAREFSRLPGVLLVEPMRSVPVRLRAGHRSRELALVGLPAGASLRRVVDVRGRPVTLPPSGVVLTDELARRLELRVGDAVRFELLEGDHRPRTTVLSGVVNEMLGLNAYMDLGALHRLLGEEALVSAVSLRVEPGGADALYARLRGYAAVAAVVRKDVMFDAMFESSGSFTAMFTLIVVAFGAIIAAGVVYNNARVAISERGRELATLRVLGFTRSEISAILLGELGTHMMMALPLGLALGNVLANAILATIDREQYRMPAMISPVTYGFAVLVVLGAALLTALWMRRRLDRLDLIEALKARD